MTMLTTPEDLEWLRKTHLHKCVLLPDFAVADIIGNEDCPTAIILYKHDHVNSLTMKLIPDVSGNFACKTDRWWII